jgi:hypothetical protein
MYSVVNVLQLIDCIMYCCSFIVLQLVLQRHWVLQLVLQRQCVLQLVLVKRHLLQFVLQPLSSIPKNKGIQKIQNPGLTADLLNSWPQLLIINDITMSTMLLIFDQWFFRDWNGDSQRLSKLVREDQSSAIRESFLCQVVVIIISTLNNWIATLLQQSESYIPSRSNTEDHE